MNPLSSLSVIARHGLHRRAGPKTATNVRALDAPTMNPLKIGNVIRVESGRIEVVLTIRDFDIEHEGCEYRVGQLGSIQDFFCKSMVDMGAINIVNAS